MEIIYKDYSELKNWEKNSSARYISSDNFEKLVLSIRKKGITDKFKIDEAGIVYDGNNRLKALKRLIDEEHITNAENGSDLKLVPCIVTYPESESDKWDIALSSNGQYASWSQEGLSNYLPEFEEELDLSLYNVDFFEHESMIDQLEDVKDEEKTGGKQEEQIQCPECGHKFLPSEAKLTE